MRLFDAFYNAVLEVGLPLIAIFLVSAFCFVWMVVVIEFGDFYLYGPIITVIAYRTYVNYNKEHNDSLAP